MRHRVNWATPACVIILAGLLAAASAAMLAQGPIAQNPAFHLFADRRTCLDLTNCADVASNLGFAMGGAAGLYFVLRVGNGWPFTQARDRWPYLVFFAGVALVSLGSAYYHTAPDNDRLLWDRLPMTIAFMALTAAFIADRIDRKIGVLWVLPILVGLGAASVIYWNWTESQGQGDLRFYFLVQFFPMLALPILCWLRPAGYLTSGASLFWLLAWYAAARLPEIYDHQVFVLLGHTVSGHTIKHLLAAVAPLVVIRMLATAPFDRPGQATHARHIAVEQPVQRPS